MDGFGLASVLLDGDWTRANLFPELGFSGRARAKQALRVTIQAHLLNQGGAIAIVALVSPYAKHRQAARRTLFNFVEVFVDCPPQVCKKRDVKGMWAKAEAGEVTGLTGHESQYERPEQPEVIVRSDLQSPTACVEKILAALVRLGFISGAKE